MPNRRPEAGSRVILDLMKLNCELTARILQGFIRDELSKAGFARVVVGLSGGIDSAVSCVLAARTLGPGMYERS